MKSVNIIIADEQTLFRQGVRALLEHGENYSIGEEASCREDLLTLLQSAPHSVVILDADLPALNEEAGTDDLVNTLGAEFPDAGIVLLCDGRSRAMLSRAVRSDVAAILLKTCTIHALRRCLAQVISGKRYIDETVTRRIRSSRLHGGCRELHEDPTEPKLTRRERQVLHHMAQGHNAPDIAGRLHISHYTVKNHKRKLMQKLDCSSSTALVAKAVARGIVHPAGEPG